MPKEKNKCLIVALTGAMGCGKSAAAAAFRNAGVEVLDADKLCHFCMESDPTVRAKIIAEFGETSYNPDGTPNRAEIAKIAFGEKNRLETLEKILHPTIENIWKSRAEEIGARVKSDNRHRILVVEVPLLFEKKLESKFDICISLYCSNAIRIGRLIQRGMTVPQINARDAFQFSAAKKAAMADIVLFNESCVNFLNRQVDTVLSRLDNYGR